MIAGKAWLWGIVFLGMAACDAPKDESVKSIPNVFVVFDSLEHFRPVIEKVGTENLHGYDFCWEYARPIALMVEDVSFDETRAKQLSAAQKTLHFFWYLDGEVSNGGFTQYFWNDYEKYLPATIDGLKNIGDTNMANLLTAVQTDFLENKRLFIRNKKDNAFAETYEKLAWQEKFDNPYRAIRENTFKQLEQYIRKHPKQFAEIE
jgi:hypothetical protein